MCVWEALDAVLGYLKLRFAYNKPGIQILARVCVDLGTTVPSWKDMCIHHLLPSQSAVRIIIKEMALSGRAELNLKELPHILEMGGGITLDGLKNNLTGIKYFDFVISWYELGVPHRLKKMKCVSL